MAPMVGLFAVLAVPPCKAQGDLGPVVEHALADFENGSLDGWQSSMSGDYYQGGHGQKGLSIVDDPERGGKVLEARIRWADEAASEPAFITYFLPEPIPAHLVTSVSFAYRLSAYHLDERMGFKVRLRYSETSFTDYDVSTGDPLPAGQWNEVNLDTRPRSNVRNIYGTLFGEVKELTLRLDDVDAENADFSLRVDDIRLAVRQPVDTPYTPEPGQRRTNDRLDVLYLRHSAEGFFPLEAAAGFAADVVYPGADEPARLSLDTQLFRGLHFPFFDFPRGRDELLSYDLIAMVDVDPYVLTWEQATWIADAVASGAGLLFVAGPNTLAHSKDFKSPIAAVLPVSFEPEAKDQAGGALDVAAPEHPVVAGLPPDRLGRVGALASVEPKPGAQVLLNTAGQPLLVVGEAGGGRSALIATWPQVSRTTEGQFYTDDCAVQLLEQLMGWLVRYDPPVLVHDAIPPPRSVVGEADVEFGLAVRTGRPRAVTVRWSTDGDRSAEHADTVEIDGEAEVAHTFHLAPVAGPQRPIELSAVICDENGHALARRSFHTQVLSPIRLEGYVWHGLRAFAPGQPVECGATLSVPGAPQLSVSGVGASIVLPRKSLSVGLPTMADVWAFQPGTESVYHSFSGGEVLGEERGAEHLLPWAETDALLRATRTDGAVFDEDDRIATVRRTLRAQPDGVVACKYEFEFVRDVRVSRMPVLLTFPVSQYAGTPFTITSAEGAMDGVLPADRDDRRDTIADVHGLDLTLETEAGPLRIKWDQPELRAWLRDLRRYDMDVYRLELDSPYTGREARTGDRYSIEFEVELPSDGDSLPSIEGLQVSARLRTASGLETRPINGEASELELRPTERRNGKQQGQEDGFARAEPVWEVGTRPAEGEVDFSAGLPDLESGPYWLEFAVGEPGEPPIASDALGCHVVDNLDRDRFFPIMSILDTGSGGHLLDEAGARARVDDLWETGFNTIAYGGAGRFQGKTISGTQTQVDRRAEEYAFSLGMASILEYTHYTRLSGRGGSGEPNPFSPESMEATRKHVQPYLEVADANPRLISVKVVDEPTVSESAIDFGEHSQEAFRERYGGELRRLAEVGDDRLGRLQLSRFLSDYVAEEYGQGYRIKQEAPRQWDLLLTYMSPGLGYGRSFSGQEDALKWSRCVDRIDFDVYPYFYPASQKIRMVQANYAHAFQRCIAQHLDKPFGFYVELDDRNYPFQINPKEASAECAYTAVGQGVMYLNSFINRSFGTGVQSRPERWEFLGEELPRIRRLGPLLNMLRRPSAPVALLYPMTQARISDGYPVPHYTFALLNSAFGDVDLLHEEVMLESGIPESCEALVMLRTTILSRKAFDTIREFVADGGLLVVDQDVAWSDETGEELNLADQGGPEFSWASPAEKLQQLGAELRWGRLGEGVAVCVDADVEQLVREAVEGDDAMSDEIADPAAFAAWHEVVRGIFDGHRWSGQDILPSAVADDDTAQVEVGVRRTQDTTMLVITNHDHRQRTAKVRLPQVPHGAGFVCDLRSMEPADRLAKRVGEGLELQIGLPGRHSTMLGIYPDRPGSIRVVPREQRMRPGGELAYAVRIETADGTPARGAHLVEVTVTDPSGAERTRYGGGYAVQDGQLDVRVPLAINAAKGEWTIEARLPAVGKSARARLNVE
jgi:uncharacterized membrane protein